MLIIKILFLVTSVYLLIGFVFYFFQERFIFLEDKLAQDYNFDFPFEYEEIDYIMEDGARINALMVRAERSKGIIFYHHGNAGNLDRWGDVTVTYTDMGWDVLIYDFRGYGKSTGVRTVKALYADAQFIYDKLRESYGEQKIILYGRSLGTVIASWLGGQNNPRAVILETPYHSLGDVAGRYYPIFPVKMLLRFPFRNFQNLQTTKSPVFIFHGTEDQIVPYDSGKKLFEHLKKEGVNVRMTTIEGGFHSDLGMYDQFREGLQKALK